LGIDITRALVGMPLCNINSINTLNAIVRFCNMRGDYNSIDEAFENHRNNILNLGGILMLNKQMNKWLDSFVIERVLGM
jgi:hypothetical protein